MKGNKFLAAVLAASMVFGAVPTMAVNAFAAATVVSPTVSDNDSTSTDAQIKAVLADGTVGKAELSTKYRSDLKASDVTFTLGTTTSVNSDTVGKGTVTSVNSGSIELDETADPAQKIGDVTVYDIKQPQVNVGVSLFSSEDVTSKNIGSGIVSVDAEEYTASEKVAIAEKILESNYGALTYYDTDDAASIKTKIKALLTNDNLPRTAAAITSNADTTKDGGVSFDYSVNVGTITKPTDKTDGSIPFSVTWTATPYAENANGVVVAGTPVTATSPTINATIPSTNRNADTDSFEDEVIAAVQAANFTTDDFDTSTTTTKLKADGLTKLKNALKDVDAIATDTTLNALTVNNVTVNRYVAGKHGTPGSARLTFTAARNDDITASKNASVTVRVAVAHGTTAIESEVYDSIYQAVEALKKDSSSLQAAGSKASTKDEIKAGLKKAIDEQLARTLGTSTTIASEIASYEVKIPDTNGYTPSTNDTKGSVNFYVIVDSGIKDSADPSKTVKWIIGDSTAVGDNGIKDAEPTTGDSDCFSVTGLAKTSAVTATSMTLPETMTYLYGSKGLKLQPTFTPSDANKYTIKWENSNTTAFGFYASEDAITEIGAADIVKYDKIPVLKTKKDGSSERTSGSTTITATLYDKDGNVLSKASTVVSIGKGFADVQNTSFFAYKAINALADTTIWKQTAKNGVDGASSDQYGPVASPVIDGVGDNMFAPNKDVTRAEFVTMLYRLAKNDYSYLTATEKIGQKDPATVGTTTKFTDVSSTAWYAQAVAWATEKGVVDGKTDTTFAPSAKITRAEAVTMLYRLYANGAKYSHRWTFTDVKDGTYYADAVAYAANDGITVGKSDTVFAPNDNLTRAEAATFIARAEVDAGNTEYSHGVEGTTAEPAANTSSLKYGAY